MKTMGIAEIDTLFDQLHASLAKSNSPSLLLDGRPIHIYGAGNVGKKIFGLLKARNLPVTAFLDRGAEPGLTWESIPILKPDDKSITQREQTRVVIGIFNRDVEISPIVQLLKSLGYSCIISFLEIHDQFAAELGDQFWLGRRSFYTSQKDKIVAAYGLWSDQVSRDLYQAILKFRFTMEYEALPRPDLENQYFPADLPSWPSPLRFVDCGAYDGDTLRYLVEQSIRAEAIAAFEPDPANFSKLVATVQEHAENLADTISLFPCGVSSKTTQIRFSAGKGEGSCSSEQGDMTIQCVALDEALAVFRPNLVKMDIEGSEYDALLGMRRSIEQYQPGLAICVYHQPEHLWTIPILAGTWLRGGRHYLRAHAFNGLELVYYWVPPKQST